MKDVSIATDKMGFLSSVNMDIARGDNVVFFGPENSGLDVIFPVILGIEEFTGEVIFEGRSVKKFAYNEKHNYKKSIGYLHGDYGLISNMTVRQNIALPLEYHSDMSEKRIKQYVDDLIDLLNLDSCKNFRPVDLSRSEILKTAFARSIALNPDLLFIEHAFEGQSPLNIQSFMDSLKDIAAKKDKSVLFVTYDPQNFLDLADRYVMIFNGRIVFDGKGRDYLESCNPYVVQYRTMSDAGPMVIL